MYRWTDVSVDRCVDGQLYLYQHANPKIIELYGSVNSEGSDNIP